MLHLSSAQREEFHSSIDVHLLDSTLSILTPKARFEETWQISLYDLKVLRSLSLTAGSWFATSPKSLTQWNAWSKEQTIILQKHTTISNNPIQYQRTITVK